MSDIAIQVENVSKLYEIGENKTFPTLRDKLMELPSRLFNGPKKNKEFWALKNVSFAVSRGEVVGIIGKNGAGKSTMLKILSRITEPTSGQITMYGRVASMLEVGTGFNPELTGRENIFLNGAIIGMTKKEIKQKFDDIVEFSGVGKFLDTPVKHYSSGMYVRLAFAVAAHLDADILLVDEVLAVGDAEFQKKCLGKMSDLARSGRTVIFVSHSMNAIKNLCSHCIWMSDGKLVLFDRTDKVLTKYTKVVSDTSSLTKKSEMYASHKEFKLKTPYWIDSSGKRVQQYEFGEKMTLRFELQFLKPMENLCFGISLVTQYGEKLFFSHSIDDKNSNIPKVLSGNITIDSSIDLPSIAPGYYRVPFGIKDQSGNPLIYSDDDVYVEIAMPEKNIDGFGGILSYTGTWKLLK